MTLLRLLSWVGLLGWGASFNIAPWYVSTGCVAVHLFVVELRVKRAVWDYVVARGEAAPL